MQRTYVFMIVMSLVILALLIGPILVQGWGRGYGRGGGRGDGIRHGDGPRNVRKAEWRLPRLVG